MFWLSLVHFPVSRKQNWRSESFFQWKIGFGWHLARQEPCFRWHEVIRQEGPCACWQYPKIGTWKKNEIQFFSVKDMHCWQVLTFLWSPIEWLTFCQNSLICYYFLWKKTEFPFFEIPYFRVLPCMISDGASQSLRDKCGGSSLLRCHHWSRWVPQSFAWPKNSSPFVL